MKSSGLLIKILTLSFFACTIIGFVAYKSGFFGKVEGNKTTAHNYDESIIHLDTIPPIPFEELDSAEQQKELMIMVGSKSGRIVYPEEVDVNDTLPDSLIRENNPSLIPSSKSGMPFPPQEKNKKVKKKKKIMSGSKSLSGVVEKEEIVEEDSFILIPSSKSAPIFEPKMEEQNQSPK